MSFAENLNREMERLGWKPIQLSAALANIGVDCHPLTVQRYLDGEREPKASLISAMACVIGCDCGSLVSELQVAQEA